MVRTWNDDIDGSPAVENVTFALRGTEYEVDLSEKNLKRLEEALEDFMIAGREVDAASRERLHAQTRAFIEAQRAAADLRAIEPPQPADLPKKQEAEYVRLQFDNPAANGDSPSPVPPGPSIGDPVAPPGAVETIPEAGAPAPAASPAKPSDVAKTLLVKPPAAKAAEDNGSSPGRAESPMDLARAAQLAVSMSKAERDVVRVWARKQTSDPDLCNIANTGRLPAYAVLKWAEAHTPARGGSRKP